MSSYLWMVVGPSSIQTWSRTTGDTIMAINYNGNSVAMLVKSSLTSNDTLFVDTRIPATYSTKTETLYPSD